MVFSELNKNPNMSISQLTDTITNNVKSVHEEKEIIPRKRHTYTHHSSTNLINEENATELTQNNNTNKSIVIPKKFSVYINKDYIKKETFIPYEKYKYKILKELVSTAHAQLYLVTEKNVSEKGGFSQSSLNLTLNSNSVINYCDNGKELVKSSSKASLKKELKSNSKASNYSLASKKHVLKVIYLAKDKNSLTIESEKKYKKMIKEALFLRELNHNNIQKFITSWVSYN